MNIALCDDENTFLSQMEELISETETFGDKAQIYKFVSGEELLAAFEQNRFDIIFLDIEMRDINGIDTAKKIRENDKNAIIVFFTSHSEYAVSGYEVNAFRYLLKNSPKAYYIRELRSVCAEYRQKHISYELKTPKAIYNIPIMEIMYFEVYGRTLLLHTVNETYEFSGKLSEITADKRLIGFIKPYKSYYVNMEYIKKIEPKNMVLKNNTIIPISRMSAQSVAEKYTAYLTEGF